MAGGATFCAEVRKRLAGRYQAADIVAYVNRGVSLVTAACPLVFDRVFTTLAPVNSTYSSFTDLDATRKVTVCHSVNGVPIPKLTEAQVSTYSNILGGHSGYVGVGSGVSYNGWSYTQNLSNVSPSLAFYPFVSGSGPSVVVSYHKVAPILVSASDSPGTYWSGSTGTANQWIDDLVIDYAELEIKRILGYVGWEALEQRFQMKLKQLQMIAANDREDTGDIQENQTLEQSKTQLGRN